MIRIGFGFDTHAMESDHNFRLGGIDIPHSKGPVGHSDADVLIHAIIDALLGAAGLRDIGKQFPDTDPALKDIDSRILLNKTMQLIRERGFSVGNIDTTIVLQYPKISHLIPEMISELTKAMDLEAGQLSIKAKTSEKLGFIGRGEGISAYAVVLLQKV
ncbi:MAG: 2-C-methyl-D-erythritol 2,4-cyclodiphosphate synthase [Bacteroidales bacterium]|jgi:2-C-methyl-D-erythritol 2,4-cyclodiphosphate synthase|nr:2-C-methyl-D-erythritol 2,4-cyclodiphosphate synthase [Bacteroidales bacterium]